MALLFLYFILFECVIARIGNITYPFRFQSKTKKKQGETNSTFALHVHKFQINLKLCTFIEILCVPMRKKIVVFFTIDPFSILSCQMEQQIFDRIMHLYNSINISFKPTTYNISKKIWKKYTSYFAFFQIKENAVRTLSSQYELQQQKQINKHFSSYFFKILCMKLFHFKQ